MPGMAGTKVIVILAIVVVGACAFAFISLSPYRSVGAGVGQGDVRGSMEFGGLNRTYLLHVLSSRDGTRSMPLVLAFHGGGGNGKAWNG
jgi:poly(3-hydroxybutyrate) depolymerase